MIVSQKRVHKIIDIASRIASCNSVSNRLGDIQVHSHYSERGYSSDSGIIVTGNWNDVDRFERSSGKRFLVSDLPRRLQRIFERMGLDVEWNDEWDTCSDCGGLVRTTADSYGWKPSYTLVEGEILCVDCIERDPESYLESIVGTEEFLCFDIDLKEYGYKLVRECETGFHPGQTDSPVKERKELLEKGQGDFIFRLDESSQFYSRWSVWVKIVDE